MAKSKNLRDHWDYEISEIRNPQKSSESSQSSSICLKNNSLISKEKNQQCSILLKLRKGRLEKWADKIQYSIIIASVVA